MRSEQERWQFARKEIEREYATTLRRSKRLSGVTLPESKTDKGKTRRVV